MYYVSRCTIWKCCQYVEEAYFVDYYYEKIITSDNDNDIGYLPEVDLEYPEKIHDLHKDYPLVPENKKPPGSKNIQLLATLYNKKICKL